jgi:gliding motility-associated-like protein
MVGDTSYYEAGSYLDTIETVHGCDSIVHLNLTVLPHSDTSIVAEICEGETYSVGSYVHLQSGTYIDTLPAANNCDSVVTLLLVVQSKDSLCFANAGPDTVLCGYSYHLIGSPEPGTWEIACPTASGVVALEMTGDGEATVKVSSCGGYDFIYTHTHIDTLEIFDSVSMQFLTVFDTCVASDLVKVGFEDPSTREIITQTDMGLVYNDYDCHSGDIVTCTNTVSSEVTTPPNVLWKFDLSGTCTSNIYSTNVVGPVSDCLASEVEITATISQGSFSLPQLCLTQDDFITLDSNGQVIQNDFWEILGNLFGQGVNELFGQCPPTPAGCFPPPPCQAEVLGYDTSYLEIPVRTGGQWVYLPDSTTMIFLEDTTDLVIGNMDYRFVIEPSATTYSPVIFKIWKILPNGNLVLPENPVSVTLQWEEHWIYDSLEIIHPIYGELPDSCRAVCPRGDIINNQISDIPLPPPFECPPFTVTFGLSSLEVVTNIVCDTTHYLVELTISGGTPPYTVAGLSGNFIATDHFISDPVAMSSGYSAEVMDAEGCVKYVWGESCPCVFLHIETDSFYALSCIDSCVIMTAEVESNISYYQVEWKRPGYSVEGNPALVCGEGTYSVRAYDPFTGCEDKTTTEAGFSFPEADAGENQTITCDETEAILQGDELTGDTSIVFSWIGPDVDTFNQYQQTLMVDLPGIYELTVTSQVTGCADTDEVTVAIENDPPSVDAGDDARFSCETDTMSLNGSAAGFAISYEWGTADGEIISGGNTPMPLIGMPGTYILVATAISNGCSGSDTVVIKPYEPVLFELEVDNDCENGSAGSVEIVGVVGYAAPYEYSLDSIVFQTNGYFEELSSGNYLVTLRDTNGCVESANALIEKIPMLSALDFAETYHFCGPNDPVLLDAFVDIDAKWVSYFWSTGADTSDVSINEAGVQYVEIATACESMRYEFELIDDLAQAAFFEVPNVFTPNDDGINDIFGPVTPNQPEEFIMYIFDRWGNRVFNTNSFENFWDGTFKNKGVPSDVYIWKIIASYHDCNGLLHSFSLKGDVTLLR